jgi:hypothetical protein
MFARQIKRFKVKEIDIEKSEEKRIQLKNKEYNILMKLIISFIIVTTTIPFIGYLSYNYVDFFDFSIVFLNILVIILYSFASLFFVFAATINNPPDDIFVKIITSLVILSPFVFVIGVIGNWVTEGEKSFYFIYSPLLLLILIEVLTFFRIIIFEIISSFHKYLELSKIHYTTTYSDRNKSKKMFIRVSTKKVDFDLAKELSDKEFIKKYPEYFINNILEIDQEETKIQTHY